MHQSAALTDLRKHPRAQLRLPARIRWCGPLGMRLEQTETIDISREGLSIYREEPCRIGTRVWVVFPFVPDAPGAVQPETSAHVVRVERHAPSGFRVGLRLQLRPRQVPLPSSHERRRSPRSVLALPILVRLAETPWPEESMTQDISRGGVRFETSRVYAVGDTVRAKVPWGEWAAAGELTGCVVRVEATGENSVSAILAGLGTGPNTALSRVAVQWIKAPKR